jgi:hypothetical protein
MKRETLQSRENRRIVLFGITMVMISFFILFCVAITVEGKSEPDKKATDRYYAEKEAVWKPMIRTRLEEEGFHNAGIMITHTDDGAGHREYTIRVHHKRFGKMTEEERECLENSLTGIAYQDAFCTATTELTD